MLWQRVLTALALIPLLVAGILLLDNRTLALILGAMLLVGAYEMARLAGLATRAAQAAFVGVIAAAMALAWHYLAPDPTEAVQWVMAIWWVLMTLTLVARRSELRRVEGRRPTILLLGALVLVTAWLSIVRLHGAAGQGPALVLYLFVLIWVADSAAYFAGRAFGRRKLSPFVSPGKTWAGAGGALAGAMVSAVVLSTTGAAGPLALLPVLALSVLVTAVSIGGDLWESRLKREAGVKDSGSLLPGHGGMLDRIDSLLAAAPVFALGTSLIRGVA
jgi:phosphatidate cytidylyltransferase